MGMTIGEKIIARAAKVDQVKAGEIHTIEVDRLMSNDGTTHLTIDMYHNQLKHPKIADKDKLVSVSYTHLEIQLGALGKVYFVDWDQLRERTRKVQIMVMGE